MTCCVLVSITWSPTSTVYKWHTTSRPYYMYIYTGRKFWNFAISHIDQYSLALSIYEKNHEIDQNSSFVKIYVPQNLHKLYSISIVYSSLAWISDSNIFSHQQHVGWWWLQYKMRICYCKIYLCWSTKWRGIMAKKYSEKGLIESAAKIYKLSLCNYVHKNPIISKIGRSDEKLTIKHCSSN